MELRGRRVCLRPAIGDDAEAMSAYLADPVVAHFLTHGPLTVADAKSRIPALNEDRSGDRFNMLFAVVLDDDVVGEAHAWNIGEHHQPCSSDPSEVWIGYALNSAYEGRGLASEAVALLLDWLRRGRVSTVFANLYDDNERSQRLLERLGFEVVLRIPADQDETGKGRASLRMALRLR